METLFQTKIPKGGEIRITEEKFSIFRGMDKTVIPVEQITEINYLPWNDDPHVFISTTTGVKTMITVKPNDKDKIKEAIKRAQTIIQP
jgi:hypothetical protein